MSNAITRSTNPVLGKEIFQSKSIPHAKAGTMTIEGTVNKSLIMLGLVVLGAFYTWRLFETAGAPQAGISAIMPWMAVGGIGGFILALVTVFKKSWVHITAPLYALLEGLFLGGISALLNAKYPGIVTQAVALTFGVMLILLLAYKSGAIKVTKKFRSGVIAATGAVALVYFISLIVQMFDPSMTLFKPTLLGIGISLVVVVIAALNLVLDFDFIYQGSQAGAPKMMEWYGAFGLTITLVWLYIEILRLLSLIAGRE